MRSLSIMAFASFLLLWGVYTYLKKDTVQEENFSQIAENESVSVKGKKTDDTLLKREKRRELDKIGAVINESNVQIDESTKEQIRAAKKVYDIHLDIKEKQALLEQSFMDKQSSIKDIKRLQDEIIVLKNKAKQDIANTEKWDPKFTYYLMIQENYTYAEVNLIKSLSENGLNAEEINYITELVKEDHFNERIQAFKAGNDTGRTIASLGKKKPKEKDDFIDDPTVGQASIESKLIEMNYNQEEKEEMMYGSQQ